MIEKFAIEVRVPVLGKSYEFLIPSVMETIEAQSLIIRMISDQNPEIEGFDKDLWLIDLESEKQIPIQAAIIESGIKNGSRLMLVHVQ